MTTQLVLTPDNGTAGDTITLTLDESIINGVCSFNGELINFSPTEGSSFTITVPPGNGIVEVRVIYDFDESERKLFTYNVSNISNICFLGNTPINTDQGIISIENIKCGLHTIHGESILAITKTKSVDYLICFEKDALYRNVPSQRTIMSKTHKVCHLGKMKEAYRFCNLTDKVYKIPYKGETLYNILMRKHAVITVNNMACETLHPSHEMVKYLNK